MSRQMDWYYRNKEKILHQKRSKYRGSHPQSHPWKSSQKVVMSPSKSPIDKMLDQLDKERRNMKW